MKFLHRLRLWLGLFRWKNYARIKLRADENRLCAGLLSRMAAERFGFDTYYKVLWRNGMIGPRRFDFRWQAIRHIRTCVRKGIRP